MALGGAWTFTLEGRNTVRGTGRTFGADADTEALGLNGDGTAGAQLPAGWVAIAGPVRSTGADFGLNALTAAQIAALLQTRVIVTLNFITDPTAGVAAVCGFMVVKNAADPWQVAFTVQASPAAPIQPEVYLEYIWSGGR